MYGPSAVRPRNTRTSGRYMLDAVHDGLAENPALPWELIHRLVTYRHGFGRVAKRADLTAEMIDEIISTDYH
jgi:hypothetical protein